MEQPKFQKNTEINEKRISHIETVLSRLVRRSQKTITTITPPIPISVCTLGDDISGSILKTLVFEGTITKGIVQLAEKPKSLVKVDMKILNNITGIGVTRTYLIDRTRYIANLNLKVTDGSVLEISVYPSGEDKLTEVLVSVLWTPSKHNINVEKYLIDELDEVVKNLLKDAR